MKKRIETVSLLIILLVSLLSFTGCNSNKTKSVDAKIGNIDDLDGKNIGIMSGTFHDSLAKEKIDDPHFLYYNNCTDLAAALDAGKIDAYVCDEPVARLLTGNCPGHSIIGTLDDAEYGYVFPKNNESEKLCRQINDYLAEITADGTLKEIDKIWFGANEELKTVDFSDLNAENGVLDFAVCTSIGAPFAYVKNDAKVGYDVDIAVRFCREYGYGIKITDSNFEGLLALVKTGKCDFGGSCITITDERKQSMLFSDPNYIGGCSVVAKTGDRSSETVYKDVKELKGKKVGVLTGTVLDIIVEENVPGARIERFNTSADLAMALENEKIAAYVHDEPMARMLLREYPNHGKMTMLTDDTYAYIFPKTERGKKLSEQMSLFIEKLKSDGTLKEIDGRWFGEGAENEIVDLSGLDNGNEVLNLAVTSDIGMPFVFVVNGQYSGYDIDVVSRFCRDYGYDLKISDTNAAGLLSSVASGKSDMGAACITVTEERKSVMLFSAPYYTGGTVLVTKLVGSDGAEKTDFFKSVADSFTKTFVRESRWKLFLSGIGVTVLITLVSALLGTILGFAVYMLYRRGFAMANAVIDTVINVLGKTPVVVILMILYYIIFGKSDLDGMWVSSIGFTLLFASAVVGHLKVGVNAVDYGQTEAALALGYTENRAFTRIVLPQAARHFLPGYSNSIVSLIKDTAIVGYIAVQDLTKVSDIVRSRTYEPFFPLIATAVIYFGVAWLFAWAVKRVSISVDPKRRDKAKILKGVETK